MGIRFMFRAVVCLALGVLTCAANFGCQTVQSFIEQSPKPTARVRSVALNDLSLQQATLNFDVAVTNPYSVALPLTDFDYRLTSGGASIVDGGVEVERSIPANDEQTMTVPATIRYADVLSVLSGVRPGAMLPYAAELDLRVDAPGVGELTLPLRHEGLLPIPAPPVITLDGVTWESLSLSEATAVLKVHLVNINDFPINLTSIDYGLKLGGTSIINTSIRKAVAIDKGADGLLEIPISITPRNLGLAALNMLQGDGAAYELAGSLDVDTPFGPMSLPFQSTGQTPFN